MKYFFLNILVVFLLGANTVLICQEIKHEDKIRLAGMVAEKIEFIYPDREIAQNIVKGIQRVLDEDGFKNISTHAEFAAKMTSLIEEHN